MVMGLREITNLNDSLRYSLVPSEKVSKQRFEAMILERNI
jgi:hypothetical protein